MATQKRRAILQLSGPDIDQKTIEILADHPMTAGRSPSSDIQLQDIRVSRQHARFELTLKGLTVQDLGSTSGVFVNDDLILSGVPVLLTVGDVIRVEHYTFLVIQVFEAGVVTTRDRETASPVHDILSEDDLDEFGPNDWPILPPSESLPEPEPQAPPRQTQPDMGIDNKPTPTEIPDWLFEEKIEAPEMSEGAPGGAVPPAPSPPPAVLPPQPLPPRGEPAPPSPGPASPAQAEAAEEVNFTLYHPKEVVAQTWYSLLTYIHLAGKLDAVRIDAQRFAAEMASDPREIHSRKTARLARGTVLTLIPSAPGLEFNPPSLTLTWLEDLHRAEFRFRASTELVGEPCLGEIQIFVGPLVVANLKFSVFVTEQANAIKTGSEPDLATVSGEMYKRIFTSYSHRDTAIVKACVAAFKAIGYAVLIDYETLRSGEDWDEALKRLIDEADIFQLFWSSNSSQSRFVRQEWEYALKRAAMQPDKKLAEGFIRPVFWEVPEPPIPPELGHIHFKYLSDLATLGE